jgi:hypothetical protein
MAVGSEPSPGVRGGDLNVVDWLPLRIRGAAFSAVGMDFVSKQPGNVFVFVQGKESRPHRPVKSFLGRGSNSGNSLNRSAQYSSCTFCPASSLRIAVQWHLGSCDEQNSLSRFRWTVTVRQVHHPCSHEGSGIQDSFCDRNIRS